MGLVVLTMVTDSVTLVMDTLGSWSRSIADSMVALAGVGVV